MTKLSRNTEEQLAAARKLMDRYDAVYSVLAKGDASPYMTEEFRAKLVEAEKRSEKYKTASARPTSWPPATHGNLNSDDEP